MRGYPVHAMIDGESISEHYAYADVLVTDISSTAIEFAQAWQTGDLPENSDLPRF